MTEANTLQNDPFTSFVSRRALSGTVTVIRHYKLRSQRFNKMLMLAQLGDKDFGVTQTPRCWKSATLRGYIINEQALQGLRREHYWKAALLFLSSLHFSGRPSTARSGLTTSPSRNLAESITPEDVVPASSSSLINASHHQHRDMTGRAIFVLSKPLAKAFQPNPFHQRFQPYPTLLGKSLSGSTGRQASAAPGSDVPAENLPSLEDGATVLVISPPQIRIS
uniref:Uncharacterized protein n=1 Tax=Coccidioides posadasii RMSCC 3488 TaxID=454284 RepID=A0A0J6F6A6_COCPO|nr:hypothetical protein CPAG_02049 [Coccidioides posadasii RMSCC 3488]